MNATANFQESEERLALRKAVADFVKGYGPEYYLEKARANQNTEELWSAAGKLGYLGVNVAEEYGGGGGGIGDLAAVLEELAAGGCPQLMMVVSPAICATIIGRFGTDEQKSEWLPGFADGTFSMAFGITEPDAGSNSHKLRTIAKKDGDDYLLTGQKVFISCVDAADAVLIVGRMSDEATGKLRPALFAVPTDAPGFTATRIEMDMVMADSQFQLFLDEVRLPKKALIGEGSAALAALFAGLNPERIMAASLAIGSARLALDKAVEYANNRKVWDVPIGAHQALAHPLAERKIEMELAKLMTQKAAALYDAGDDMGAGEAANMAKYAAAEMNVKTVESAVQTLGGNGLTVEYGLGAMLASSRLARIAPISREMVLNFVSEHTLGLPKSY
ncbi:acyl-CoA dehydrogenase family protein [Sciscionella sediminilitoris]|uniref:acyl-CoA dehydrogenase family protein n=1 Tax=Sciscionella sediminilitoris TaxID=1445613 RepID=UPI0004DFADBA|nr:acyl-CoA dehydrogenase family protein [Sciscionella sp. SE31]